MRKQICSCYGINKEWGHRHCPIHRYTKDSGSCNHDKLSIDDMNEKGMRRCRDCGKYIKAINVFIDPVINPKKRYSPRFIGTHTCWILNSAGKPSHQFVLNEIKMGSLKAIPVPPKGVKKIILGAEIMRYRKERGY